MSVPHVHKSRMKRDNEHQFLYYKKPPITIFFYKLYIKGYSSDYPIREVYLARNHIHNTVKTKCN